MNRSIASVRLNNYRKTSEERCFQSSTVGKQALPASVCDISEHTFDECEHSQHANLGAAHALKSIGDDAFAFSALRQINIADSALESIGASAFMYSKLRSFTAPSFLRAIGESAFSGCSSLRHADLSDMQWQ